MEHYRRPDGQSVTATISPISSELLSVHHTSAHLPLLPESSRAAMLQGKLLPDYRDIINSSEPLATVLGDSILPQPPQVAMNSYGFSEYKQICLPSSASTLPWDAQNKTRMYYSGGSTLNAALQSSATSVMRPYRSGSAPAAEVFMEDAYIYSPAPTVYRRASAQAVGGEQSRNEGPSYTRQNSVVSGVMPILLPLPSVPITTPHPPTEPAPSKLSTARRTISAAGIQNSPQLKQPQPQLQHSSVPVVPILGLSSPTKPDMALPPPPILLNNSMHSSTSSNVTLTTVPPAYYRHASVPATSMQEQTAINSTVSRRPSRTLSSVEQSPSSAYTSTEFQQNAQMPPAHLRLASTPSPQTKTSSLPTYPFSPSVTTYPSSSCPATSSNNITIDPLNASPVNVFVVQLSNYRLDYVNCVPNSFEVSDMPFPTIDPVCIDIPSNIFNGHVIIPKLIMQTLGERKFYFNAAQICSIIANDDVEALTRMMDLGLRADSKFAQVQFKIPYRSVAAVRSDAQYKDMDRSFLSGNRRSSMSVSGDGTWLETDLAATHGEETYNSGISLRRSFISSGLGSDTQGQVIDAVTHPWRVVSPIVSVTSLAVMWSAARCLSKLLTLVHIDFINAKEQKELPLLFQLALYNNTVDNDDNDAFDDDFICAQPSEPEEVFAWSAAVHSPPPYEQTFTLLTHQSKRARIQDMLVLGGAVLGAVYKRKNFLGLLSSLGDFKLAYYQQSNHDMRQNDKNTGASKDPLHIAVRNLDPRMAAVLLHFNYNVNTPNVHGNTPLQCCVALAEPEPCSCTQECKFHRSLLIARLLLNYNADCNTPMLTNDKRYHLTDIALSVSNQSMFSLLVASGCHDYTGLSFKACEQIFASSKASVTEVSEKELNGRARKGSISSSAMTQGRRGSDMLLPTPAVISRPNKTQPPPLNSFLAASPTFSVTSDTPSFSARSSKAHSPFLSQAARKDEKNQTLTPSTHLTTSSSSHTIVTGSQQDMLRVAPPKERTKHVKDNKEAKRDKKEKKEKKDKKSREVVIPVSDSPMLLADGKSIQGDSRSATSLSYRPNISVAVLPLSSDTAVPGSPIMQPAVVNNSPGLSGIIHDDFAFEYGELDPANNERFQPHPGMERTLDPRAATRKLGKTSLSASITTTDKSVVPNSPALRSKARPRRSSVDAGGDI